MIPPTEMGLPAKCLHCGGPRPAKKGRRKFCSKKCGRAYRLDNRKYVDSGRKRTYGIRERYGATLEEAEELLQRTHCDACGEAFVRSAPGTGGNRHAEAPTVDHDHATGKIRGVLHMNCNRALGLLYDNPHRIEGLLRYINVHTK